MGALMPDAEAAEAPVEPIVQPWLLHVDAAATGVFALLAIAAVLAGGVWVTGLVVVSAVLFIAGSIACLWAFAIAVRRSRYVEIAPTQLYFLTGGCAPAVVRNRFLTLLTIQVVVGLIAAGLRPFTGVAFGILVPMFGLGVAGLWAARNGTYPDRVSVSGSDRSSRGEDRQE